MRRTGIIIVLIMAAAALYAQQPLPRLETYQQLQVAIDAQRLLIDSLKVELSAQTADIDAQRQRSSNAALRDRMADALVLTEAISRHQQTLESIIWRHAAEKTRLAARFGMMIDSLKQLERRNGAGGDHEALRQDIMTATAYYLLFSPVFQELPFDPQQITRMNPATSDSLEREMTVEYLHNTITDVDFRLDEIRKNRRELAETIKLARKADEFMTDIADDNLGLLAQGVGETQKSLLSDANRTDFGLSENTGVATRQLEAISVFLGQLGVETSALLENSYKIAVDSHSSYVSLDDYLQLLNIAEERLEAFRKAIAEKLEAEDAAQ